MALFIFCIQNLITQCRVSIIYLLSKIVDINLRHDTYTHTMIVRVCVAIEL